ncbi:MAG TPA: glycosyltransferase [Candidatus Competibacteraceae bacterium]|nr:glycosyltransferase [Candidatus Competibacteraceae bacterium]
MKILVLTGFWPTKANPISGVFVAQQCAAFERAGCDVRIVSIGNTFHKPATLITENISGFVFESAKLCQIRVNNLPEHLFRLPGALKVNSYLTGQAIYRHIDKLFLTWKPDAVLVHGLRYIATSIAHWRNLIKGRSVIVLHGVDPQFAPHRVTTAHRKHLMKVLPFIDTVVAVGNPLRSYSKDIGLGDPLVIPNGTDLPPLKEIHFSQRPFDETRVVLSVSNLVKLKGIDLNLRALARFGAAHPDTRWEYRVIGDGPERANLEQLARALGIQDRVRFLGRLNHSETMQQVGDCDIFSLPSWGEAFGIVYLEAMARGRPVIGCWQNGAQDIISHQVDGLLVMPQEERSLFEALNRMLIDPLECSKWGRSARVTAERFSWDANSQRMLQALGLM